MKVIGIGLIFDLVMVLVLVLSIIIGRKKGLLRTLFSAGIIIFAILLAFLVSPYVAKNVEKWGISKTINNKIFSVVNDKIKENDFDFDGLMDKYNIPDSIANVIEKKADDIKNAQGEVLARKIADKITEIAIKFISFVLVAVVVVILLILISMILKIVSKLPIIGTFDKLGGALVGLLIGIFLVFIACVLIYFISLVNVGGAISEIASSSVAMKIVDKIGLIKGIIK